MDFQVSGDWWVVLGVNCGQDDVWIGGYDWYPCQHQRQLSLDQEPCCNIYLMFIEWAKKPRLSNQ